MKKRGRLIFAGFLALASACARERPRPEEETRSERFKGRDLSADSRFAVIHEFKSPLPLQPDSPAFGRIWDAVYEGVRVRFPITRFSNRREGILKTDDIQIETAEGISYYYAAARIFRLKENLYDYKVWVFRADRKRFEKAVEDVPMGDTVRAEIEKRLNLPVPRPVSTPPLWGY